MARSRGLGDVYKRQIHLFLRMQNLYHLKKSH
jgi:hypothetical protein